MKTLVNGLSPRGRALIAARAKEPSLRIPGGESLKDIMSEGGVDVANRDGFAEACGRGASPIPTRFLQQGLHGEGLAGCASFGRGHQQSRCVVLCPRYRTWYASFASYSAPFTDIVKAEGEEKITTDSYWRFITGSIKKHVDEFFASHYIS